ncbi:MAG TPA: alpha/beta hydrolase [Bacteroidetes bacterium]|nr:alpha/beta hydrolase [Bacteroidota bacterium]
MMRDKPKLYLIPGLGSDRRIFTGLKRQGLEFEVIEFIPPLPGEKLREYAIRLAAPIDVNQPFIIGGVSLGGIMSVEIARHFQPEKVILISSVKTAREVPFYFKLLRYLPLHRPMSGNFFKYYVPRDKRKGMADWHNEIVDQMRKDADPDFVKWAIHAVVHWRNQQVPENLIHIHGTHDVMFPAIFLGPRTTIQNGRHIMVLSNAELVMAELEKHL